MPLQTFEKAEVAVKIAYNHAKKIEKGLDNIQNLEDRANSSPYSKRNLGGVIQDVMEHKNDPGNHVFRKL